MKDIEVLMGLFNKTINFSMEKLYIELTNRCNLKCKHCYNDSNNGTCIDLPIEVVKNMLFYTNNCGLTSVALSGGEALLYPKVNEVFSFCNDIGLDVFLLTNGTYFDEKKYMNILFEYLPEVQVSLDGPDASSNDMIRGEGNFENAISFIRRLKKSEYPKRVTVNTVLTEYTLSNYGDMVRLCNELGVDELTYSFITMAGRAKQNNLQMNNDYFYSVVKDINTNIKPNKQNNCQGVGINHVCSLTTLNNGIIKLQPKVTCKGEVFPCQMHQKPEYIIGNVNTCSLDEVLNSEESRRFIALMYLRKNYMEECNRCMFKTICGRGCMAKSVNDYSNPISVDGCCIFYKELIVEEIKSQLN